MADRMKTRKVVVQKLSPLLKCTNVSRLLSEFDHKHYDIAEDAQLWQFSLKNIVKYVHQYDMASIFLMPDIFSLSDSCLLATALEWTTILEKFGEVRLTTSIGGKNLFLPMARPATLKATTGSRTPFASPWIHPSSPRYFRIWRNFLSYNAVPSPCSIW